MKERMNEWKKEWMNEVNIFKNTQNDSGNWSLSRCFLTEKKRVNF